MQIDNIDLGEKLTQAQVDWNLIIIKLSIQLTIAGLIVLAGIRSNPLDFSNVNLMNGIIVLLLFLCALAWVINPLFHIKDYIIFFSNGVEYCGKKIPIDNPKNVSFICQSVDIPFYSKLYVKLDDRRLDITYIKEAKKMFNRAYNKTI